MEINLQDLTQEQQEQLKKQIIAEEKEKREKIRKEQEEYKRLVEEAVTRNFERLQKASKELAKVKTEVFNDLSTLIKLKGEIYGVPVDKQFSHTFTDKQGYSVVVGSRIMDSFDDTVHVGIEKIKGYLKTIVTGEKAIIEDILDTLLKKDKNGNMKANRVLELRKLAEKINNEAFLDGVKIIEDAYKPLKSKIFIDCYYKDPETGEKKYVPLTMTGV